MRGLLVIAYGFACLFWAATAWSADGVLTLDSQRPSYALTTYLEYLRDDSHTLRLEDMTTPAVEARFRPAATGGRINFGYTSAAYWLRLRLDDPEAGRWLLEIAYPTLDRVDLYYTDGSGQMAHLHSGDLLPFAERPYPHRNLVFPVDLPKGPALLYLRVESQGSMTIPATLWRPDDFAKEAPRVYALQAMYFGSLLALGLYNLLLYLSIRDRAYLEYVLFVVGMAIGQASANGLAQEFIWPNWPAWGNLAFPAGFAITGLFGAAFTRTFLETRRTAPALDQVLAALVVLFIVSLAVLTMSYRIGAMVVSLGGLSVSITSLAAGVMAWRRGHPGARFFLLAWTVLLIGVGVLAMRNFGWLPTNYFTVYAMQVGSTLDLLLLSFALADRINTMRSEKETAQAQLLGARQHMVETLKRSEEELETRVETRTRELAAANADLKRQEQKLSLLARQDALTGLGNRIALEEEMRRAIGRSGRLGTGLAVMLLDLDRFKPINDEHGHGIGDEVLREVASRLGKCTRKTDTVARLGGDEFVILVEGRDVVADAQGVASKVLACLGREFEVNDLTLRLGASIGAALLRGSEGPDDLLRRADRAMYTAKREGGNRFALEPG